MTAEVFGQMLGIIAAAYGVEFSEARRKVWWELLKDLPDREARAATVRMCRTSPYPPKPADLVRAVSGTPEERERGLEEEAELALAHLEAHLCGHRIVNLGPTLNAVVRAMGGVDAVMARITSDEWKYDRKRAAMLYRAYLRRGVGEGDAAALIPAAMAEGLAAFPPARYEEQGLVLPIEHAPFGGSDVPVLPALTAGPVRSLAEAMGGDVDG